jgi:hypothetical protein
MANAREIEAKVKDLDRAREIENNQSRLMESDLK